MSKSNFNLKNKLIKTIMNYLFPKLENICDVFDINEITAERRDLSTRNSLGQTGTKYKFSIKSNANNNKKGIFITISQGYSTGKSYMIEEFEEKNKMEYEELMEMSDLFLIEIGKYCEKEKKSNEIIDKLKKLEIIYRKELILEKIKKEKYTEKQDTTIDYYRGNANVINDALRPYTNALEEYIRLPNEDEYEYTEETIRKIMGISAVYGNGGSMSSMIKNSRKRGL